MANTIHFKPGKALTFKSVVEVRASLYKALQNDSLEPFYLDLAEVQHCDSAGLALLIEAKKLCQQHQRNLKVVGSTPQILALAEFCGVSSFITAQAL